MNEIQLSDSLPVIETEIRQYQNLAGESIFEIGRRLKHVKENDLAHGEFGKWLESLNMNHNVANKMMKVASTEGLNYATSHNIGMQALYEIATLPEPERTKEHVTAKGETKTPDEMTVKELRELKKQLKQRDEENTLLQSKLDEAENKAPEVIEKYTEPEDYEDTKNMNEHLAKEREYYKNLADDFRKEIKSLSNATKTTNATTVAPTDQTKLALEILEHLEMMIESETVSIDKESIKNKLTKISKKVDE